jgi:Flp pilus assembly protein protease CpaA
MGLRQVIFWNFAFYTVTGSIWGLALAFTLCAGWLDWRTRRIPNWLTVPGAVAGLALNSIVGGRYGAVRSLEGTGLALGLMLLPVLLRGMGAGDWKLMGAVGAMMGWHPLFFVLLVSILTSGLMAASQMFVAGRVNRTMRNVLRLAAGLATFGARLDPKISLDNPTLMKVPFGVATGAAMALTFALTHWRQ